MGKKQLLIATLFILGVVTSGFLVVKALVQTEQNTDEAAKSVYTNPDSTTVITQYLSESLTAVAGENEDEFRISNLRALHAQAALNELYPNLMPTPMNHFHSVIGTSHPYSAYGNGQLVRGESLAGGIGAYLEELSLSINQEPRNAELELNAQKTRAEHFVPHQIGQTLLLRHAANILKQHLYLGGYENNHAVLAVHTMEPAILLSDLNGIGIQTLVSQGISDFSGSSASRIHNIRVGANRYNGLIIQPGEEFSFNKHLGPVDGAHGFLPELVIKAEGTVPEFGGGLCQVSSTAFRAAFFGGLPITQRKNHSYAVSYYRWINEDISPSEGLDATIYPGVVDLKFKNDTGGALLVATRMEGRRLYFDFYGSPDNRQVVVDGPITYDRRASGAVKAEVSRKVVLGGTETEETFYSSYVSPDLYPRSYEYADNKESEEQEQPVPVQDEQDLQT